MNIYLSVFVVAIIFSLVAFLWLAMTGFKRSALWGILVLLFSPISAVIFAMSNWFEARMPFLVYIVAFLLVCGSAGVIASEVGMNNLQQIGARLHSGKLGTVQAYNLLNKAMAQNGSQDLFTVEAPVASATTIVAQSQSSPVVGNSMSAGVADPIKNQDEAKPAKTELAASDETKVDNKSGAKPELAAPMPVANEPDVSKQDPKTAKSEETKPAEHKEETEPATPEQSKYPNLKLVEPDPLAQKKKKEEPNTVVVSVNKVHNYIGHYFIITLKSGSERRGLLRHVDESRLVLDRKLYGGKIEYRISKSQIKSIQMLKHPPEER